MLTSVSLSDDESVFKPCHWQGFFYLDEPTCSGRSPQAGGFYAGVWSVATMLRLSGDPQPDRSTPAPSTLQVGNVPVRN